MWCQVFSSHLTLLLFKEAKQLRSVLHRLSFFPFLPFLFLTLQECYFWRAIFSFIFKCGFYAFWLSNLPPPPWKLLLLYAVMSSLNLAQCPTAIYKGRETPPPDKVCLRELAWKCSPAKKIWLSHSTYITVAQELPWLTSISPPVCVKSSLPVCEEVNMMTNRNKSV